MRKTALKWTAVLLAVLLAGPAMAARCRNTGSFEKWLADFKKEALAQGISPQVLAEAAPDLTFDPAIIPSVCVLAIPFVTATPSVWEWAIPSVWLWLATCEVPSAWPAAWLSE